MRANRFVLQPLSLRELLELQHLIRSEGLPSYVPRRAMLIWLLEAGFTIREAADIVGCHYTNAHFWIKRFRAEGAASLLDRPRPGRPRLYDRSIETRVIELIDSHPADLGLGFRTWSLAKLEQYLRLHEGIEGLSRETIRRMLRRNGFRFVPGSAWQRADYPTTPPSRDAPSTSIPLD